MRKRSRVLPKEEGGNAACTAGSKSKERSFHASSISRYVYRQRPTRLLLRSGGIVGVRVAAAYIRKSKNDFKGVCAKKFRRNFFACQL